MTTTISSLRSLTLDLPPSCIQFSPTHPELFVVGTYYLHGREHGDQADDDENAQIHDASIGPQQQQQQQQRTGSLLLFRLEHDENITQVSAVATAYAVLDVQWSPVRDAAAVLAVAASTGLVEFYRLVHDDDDDEDGGTRLVRSHARTISDPDTLVLSLTWHPVHAHILGLTLSDGSVCVLDDARGETVEVHAHDLEAWIVAFDPYSITPGHDVLFSGGDDTTLRCSTFSRGPDRPTTTTTTATTAAAASPSSLPPPSARQLWQDRRLHQAGITYLLPLTATLVLTGSYDDHIRLLSLPARAARTGRRRELAGLDLGGGVWRLKLLDETPASRSEHRTDRDGDDTSTDGDEKPPGPSRAKDRTARSYTLLASCMHAGARIVRLTRHAPVPPAAPVAAAREGDHENDDDDDDDEDDPASWEFTVLARFTEHESMNYGSDAPAPAPAPAPADEATRRTIVSTSFYDRKMCVWRY